MKLKEMSKEELEVLSYTDLTEIILKENKKAMNTPSIFKKICDLLELTEEDYANQIGDYYTSLTTDKRFILLDTAEWDLKDKHKVEINLDEVSKDVEKILLCVFVDDPKFDPEKYCFSTFKCISKTFSDQTLEKEIAELPIDSWFKINTSGAIIAFNIERYINQWIITMVNDSIDVDFDAFLKKF